MTILGRVIGMAAIGTVALPALLLPLLIGYFASTGHCGAPGDNHACESSIATALLIAAPLGAALGLVYGLWRHARISGRG